MATTQVASAKSTLMKRALSWLLPVTFLACVGCGSDDEGSGGSAGTNGQPDTGVDALPEASSEAGQQDALVEDAGDARPESGLDASEDAFPDAAPEAGPDVAVDVVTEAAQDAEPDAPADAPTDASDRPPGQCTQDDDCAGPNAACSMSAPGGICLGCGQDSDCGNPLDFECYAAACRRYCAGDEDCPLGMECSANLYCKLMNCSSSCPPPYVCHGGLCRRPECSSASPQCPDGMSCGQDDYCVED